MYFSQKWIAKIPFYLKSQINRFIWYLYWPAIQKELPTPELHASSEPRSERYEKDSKIVYLVSI